ncbi:MAG: tRNA preQ1(34) S-adenosylmethionine ribosyltransferase-isomerase QueA [Pseudomonadota bacterium]
MRRQDFHFDLPERLIAQQPAANRSASRLLMLDRKSGRCVDRQFAELPDLLEPDDLLVFNDTRVINARLRGNKASGGRVELLIERITGPQRCLAQVRASRSPGVGTELLIGESRWQVAGRADSFFDLQTDTPILDLLDRYGEVPLPPYIRRPDGPPRSGDADAERYQTVYARNPGAVAAPTAGLHFDPPLLDALRRGGVQFGYLTLHVGAGTFQPVRVDDIKTHAMHTEWFRIDDELVAQIRQTRERGGRVIAVGTTSLRALESAYRDRQVRSFEGETDIFIYPGVPIHSCQGLITNFHLPESTLMMLVSAMAGHETIMRAYAHAVAQEYRFFSYGDAMLIR